MLPKEKIGLIKKKILSKEDRLIDIKAKINDVSITFNEINCVLASIKYHTKKSLNALI